jgi:soluble P-type ATPase
MIDVNVPGFTHLRLEHLMLDYNGTLARDGVLLNGVKERLERLSQQLRLHVVTADTFGNVRAALAGLPCEITILPTDHQAPGKLTYVEHLGANRTACVGNGRNDRLMLKAAALSIVVVQEEGAAIEALASAHVAVPNIIAALDLLMHPLRLVATLRS